MLDLRANVVGCGVEEEVGGRIETVEVDEAGDGGRDDEDAAGKREEDQDFCIERHLQAPKDPEGENYEDEVREDVDGRDGVPERVLQRQVLVTYVWKKGLRQEMIWKVKPCR